MARLLLKPFTVRLRGKKWKVRFASARWLKSIMGIAVDGYCDYDEYSIVLNRSTSVGVVRETLWHELTHAMLSVNRGSTDADKGVVNEELACNLVGTGLAEVLTQPLPEWVFKEKTDNAT